MGSALSRPARKLARAPPSWAGTRTPNPGDLHPHSRPSPQASETRDEAIERDSKDPHLLANLNRLGPVTVDRHMQTVRPAAASADRLFQTRLRSEDEARASRPTRNRLVASSLMELLESRNYATTHGDIETLAKNYDIDLDKFQRLARHVNSVNVDQDAVKRSVSKDGVENVIMSASWANPRIQHQQPMLH